MSQSDSVQAALSGDEPAHIRDRDHLSMAGGESADLDASVERNECWCEACGKRVTVGSEEWGHARGCEFSCRRTA